MKRSVCGGLVGVLLICGGLASAWGAMASGEARLAGPSRLPALQAPAWATLNWPAGVRWQPVLWAARWQGCPLDAVLFHSPRAPVSLAQDWAQQLASAQPGLLSEPDGLSVHWYRDGWHWLVQLLPSEHGGTRGSVSALAVQGCQAQTEMRPASWQLVWQDGSSGQQVTQRVRPLAAPVVSAQTGWRHPPNRRGQVWERDVRVGDTVWRVRHEEKERP